MKKIYLSLLMACILAGQLFSQSVTFKPDANVGEDAMIRYNNDPNCRSWAATNWGWLSEIHAIAWTWGAAGCGSGVSRNLIRFTQLSTLPAGAVVTYAELRLFGVSSSGNYGNSFPSLSSTDYNNGWVRRVTSSWAENTVTWNSQPSITTTGEVAIPVSTSRWNENLNLDVTNQVVASIASGQNEGFMIMLDNENYYRSWLFASSDHPNSNLWPELYVEYTLPCNFSYCTKVGTPGVYTFSAPNPLAGYTYQWNFGDGTVGYGSSVSHSYTAVGNYQVCLYVTSPDGSIVCEKCTPICVAQAAPCTTRFVYIVRDGLWVDFEAITTGQEVESYSWNFGDTKKSDKGPSESHLYGSIGMYRVCLTVKYKNGCIVVYCWNVIVGDYIDWGDWAKTGSAAPAYTDKPPFTEIDKPASGIKVSPNPADGNSITVSIDAEAAGNFKYTVYNAQGRPAFTGNERLVQGTQNIQVGIGLLTPGKYWIEFSNNSRQLRASFIKL